MPDRAPSPSGLVVLPGTPSLLNDMNTFLFYNTDSSGKTKEALIFKELKEIIRCTSPSEVYEKLDYLDQTVNEGYYLCGFLSYELGLHFQEIPLKRETSFPLFLFGVFNSCEKVPLDKLGNYISSSPGQSYSILNDNYSQASDQYIKSLEAVKEHIACGNTYQVNYTFKYNFDFQGDPSSLFNTLRKKQHVPYASLINTDKWSIVSLSPELFFEKTKDDIKVRPMKGTIHRGKTMEEDEENKAWLENSIKNRAENIMIVDLLRNDLGRISETGSVSPEKIFTIEKYKTLFQMTSTINSRLKKDITWKEIFQNIFPSGSVTGAPKKRTMEIIQDLEKEPRDIYTGSIGYISPEGKSVFNVAIRTILIDKSKGRGSMGIGSGIVYDSHPEKEYTESVLKGSFLTNKAIDKDFDLLETILWENGEYFLLDLHLKRLENSAGYFSYKLDKNKILKTLNEKSLSFDSSKKYRIRMLSSRSGELTITCGEIEPDVSRAEKIALSSKKIDKENIFFYHKTTNRNFYDKEFEKYRKQGFFDVIFVNNDNEITEGAISNILIEKDKNYYTPPISCGLLSGVYREHLLKTGKLPMKEKVLGLEDLENADKIFLTNSVRKMVEVSFS